MSKKKRKKRKQKKTSKLRIIIGLLIILLGAGCFLYPNFREWRTQKEVDEIIDEFHETFSEGTKDNDSTEKNIESKNAKDNDRSNLSDKNKATESKDGNAEDTGKTSNNTGTQTQTTRPYQSLYTAMQAYNESLVQDGQKLTDVWSYEEEPFDLSSWDFINRDKPVIGYIEIPDMELRMPLILGASETNLAKGACVLSQTSMPIGGKSTNCVIAGHRGWKGSAYFQHVDRLSIGSKVYVTNPWETLVYEVKYTKIIDPEDIDSIKIQDGKDMITLFTCHPYMIGGGPYRFLAFCERVDTTATSKTTDKATNKQNFNENSDSTKLIPVVEDESISDALQNDTNSINLTALEHVLRIFLPITLIIFILFFILIKRIHRKKR